MDIMINKYIAVIDNEYDRCSVLEFFPFQTKYTPEEILLEYTKQIDARTFKGFTLLDTGIRIYVDSKLNEILTIQEWFTKYATGVKETRDDVDLKIKNQYVG